MTPADVADWLTEKATDVSAIAAQRYPHTKTDRLLDEAAQLRLLVEQAAEHLHQFAREREQHVEEIARLSVRAEILNALHEFAAKKYEKRIGRMTRDLAALRGKKGARNA